MKEIKLVCIREVNRFTKNKHYTTICDVPFYYITNNDGKVNRFLHWEVKHYFITLKEHRDIKLKLIL